MQAQASPLHFPIDSFRELCGAEHSKNTEKVLAELLPQYLDQVGMALPASTWHSHIPDLASGEVPTVLASAS